MRAVRSWTDRTATHARVAFAAIALATATPALADPAPTGAWDCDTDAGRARLEFRSTRTLVFDGVDRAYRILGDAIQVIEDGLPANYTFRLAGDALDITTPDGDALRCRKAAVSDATPERRPEDSGKRGAERQFNHLLQGALCAWAGSSSSTGSTSRTTTARFDGRGRFTVTGDASFGGQNGLGYGGGEEGGGTYEVTSPQVGAAIRIRWSTGEDDAAVVSHVVSGQIAEIRYGKTLFAAGLCNR
ncbi:MAG: hypothetical protein MUF30_11680 [Burkholderiales bacterium]|jgi:hypothetical protein|nr:hypothetical protein [Burkholderiales bacterium]